MTRDEWRKAMISLAVVVLIIFGIAMRLTLLRLLVKPFVLVFALWYIIDLAIGEYIDLILFVEMILFAVVVLPLIIPALLSAPLTRIYPTVENHPARLAAAAVGVVLFGVLTTWYYASMPWQYAQGRQWRIETIAQFSEDQREFMRDLEDISSVLQDNEISMEERPHVFLHYNIWATGMLESWLISNRLAPPSGESHAYNSPFAFLDFLEGMGMLAGLPGFYVRALIWFIWSQFLIVYPYLSPFLIGIIFCTSILFRHVKISPARRWCGPATMLAAVILPAVFLGPFLHTDKVTKSDQATTSIQADTVTDDRAAASELAEVYDDMRGLWFRLGDECRLGVEEVDPGDPVNLTPHWRGTVSISPHTEYLEGKQGNHVEIVQLYNVPTGLLGHKKSPAALVRWEGDNGQPREGWIPVRNLMPSHYFVALDSFTNWWLYELWDAIVAIVAAVVLAYVGLFTLGLVGTVLDISDDDDHSANVLSEVEKHRKVFGEVKKQGI